MGFFRRAKDAMLAGFFGGIGAGIGSFFVNGIGSVLTGRRRAATSSTPVGTELFGNFQAMPETETANLRRRLKDALQHNDGDRFLKLLSRIPAAPQEGRQKALKYLNDISDEHFNEMMRLLEYPQSMSDRLAKHLGGLADHIEGSKQGKNSG